MYITSNRRMNLIDFDEYRMNNFFYRSTKKNSYTLRLMESISSKGSSIQMVHLIELKFGMYVIGYRPTFCVDFGKFSINNSFAGVQKKEFLCISAYGIKL